MKPSSLKRAIERAFAAELVPFVKGRPGLGKSAIIRQIAQEHNLKVLDLRLGRDLARHDDEAGRHQRLRRHPASGVLL